MSKNELTEKIRINSGLTKRESADILDTVFSIVKETLNQGENLKISGFGSFEIKEKSPRNGRNPQTGETITISRRRVLSFKPSSVLKAQINQGNPECVQA